MQMSPVTNNYNYKCVDIMASNPGAARPQYAAVEWWRNTGTNFSLVWGSAWILRKWKPYKNRQTEAKLSTNKGSWKLQSVILEEETLQVSSWGNNSKWAQVVESFYIVYSLSCLIQIIYFRLLMTTFETMPLCLTIIQSVLLSSRQPFVSSVV